MITHDNQTENPYNKILHDINTADRKKREYPVLRPDRENQCRNFTERQDNHTGKTPSFRYTGAVLMPRRPAKIERDIPLYLISNIVKRGVVTHGQALERVIVSRTRNHFYNVSIRTRRVKRELRSSWVRSKVKERPEGEKNEDRGTDDGTGSERG